MDVSVPGWVISILIVLGVLLIAAFIVIRQLIVEADTTVDRVNKLEDKLEKHENTQHDKNVRCL